MDTTTTDGGANAQPESQDKTPAAVTTGHNADQVITTDESGTPTLAPVTGEAETQVEAEPTSTEGAEAAEPQGETAPEPAQADDIESWATKKGLPMDDPKKLAQMVRESEKRMHQATEKAKEFETASVAQVPLEYTGDPNIDSLAANVNTLLIRDNVREFFNKSPEAREYESKMAEIVTQRPHLQNDLDALYALARTDPSRESDLKAEGGRQALTNLAQKQSAVPPGTNATNSGEFVSAQIDPRNVYDLVDKNDQAWFEKNHKAISDAMAGK